MNKIVKNLSFLKIKSWNNIKFLRKIAMASLLSAIVVSLLGSNLAFAEIGGGTRILATLGTLQGK